MTNNNKTTAVIDVGSNSVRLMLPEKDGVNEKKLNTTRLAENLSLTGFLSDAAMTRSAEAVKEFYAEAQKSGYKNVCVFATEAVRAAKNGNDFVALLAQSGITVDVIDGETEAEIGYLGAAGKTKSASVFDIGGASVEVVCGIDGGILRKKSLPLGLVRLKDLLGSDEKVIENYVAEKITQFGEFGKSEVLIGIGGTAPSVAAMLSGEKVYRAEKIHGKTVTLEEIVALRREIFDRLGNKNLSDAYPVISPARAEIIAHGVIVTENILRYLGYDKFTASETDNMEGYLLRRQ